jgi:acetyl-CoA acyltransferase 1
MERVKQIVSHLTPSSSLASLEAKHPDDVVITMAIRSPLTKAKKGGFKDATYVSLSLLSVEYILIPYRSEDLLLEMFKVSAC